MVEQGALARNRDLRPLIIRIWLSGCGRGGTHEDVPLLVVVEAQPLSERIAMTL